MDTHYSDTMRMLWLCPKHKMLWLMDFSIVLYCSASIICVNVAAGNAGIAPEVQF